MSNWLILKRLLGYTVPYRWRLIVGVVASFLAGGSIFGILRYLPKVLGFFDHPPDQLPSLGMIRTIAQRLGVPEGDQALTARLLVVAVCCLVGFFLFKAFFTYLNRYYMRWVGCRVIQDLRNDLFATLQAQSLTFYGRTDVGQLISRCVNDTGLIESTITTTIADFSQAPVEILAALVVIACNAADSRFRVFPVVIFVVLPLLVFPLLAVARRVKNLYHNSLRRIAELISRMHENFTCIRVVKAFHTEAAEEARFRAINQRYFRQLMKALRTELLMTPMIEVVAVVLIGGFLVLCWHQRITLSEIVGLVGALVFAYTPMKQLTRIVPKMQQGMAAAERVFELIDTQCLLPEAPQPKRLETFTDRVVFTHVSHRYEGAAGAPEVLHDVSLEMSRGKVVAFVGQTGSGKTTLANLLARFYDPSEGRITIDGTDLREVEIASIRRLVGVVGQETILFNDTIANNIAYGSPAATREQIIAAAKRARAHDFIMAEPEGYERLTGEKGFVLSGGQRQRIAIARAILRNPEILILDEATSALDTVTEQLVQEALTELMQERTVFAIAHRLSTIRHAHCIYVLDGGRIVESGTHAELLALNGVYRDLNDRQHFA